MDEGGGFEASFQ